MPGCAGSFEKTVRGVEAARGKQRGGSSEKIAQKVRYVSKNRIGKKRVVICENCLENVCPELRWQL